MHFERSYDVVVAGAGVAGIAAALETARAGLKTALVEKTILTGGLATTGLVYVYLPLCDGCGTQVTFGIAEELLHLSIKYGPGRIPNWRKAEGGKTEGRYLVRFSPAAFTIALDEALMVAGVDVWLDTLICETITDGDRVTGVEVENKSGRGALRGQVVIDATGDADVAFRAGAECADGDNWLTIWAIVNSLQDAKTAVDKSDGTPLMRMLYLGGDNAGGGQPGGSRIYKGTTGEEVSDFILKSRKLLLGHCEAKWAEAEDSNRHNYFPITLPSMAQFRTSRRVVCQTTMRDGQHAQHVDDSVGLVADWRKSGFVWEIPYGALVPTKVKGLLAAGRCVDSDGDAWQVMRVIPPAAHTGQVCGVAAELAIEHNTTPDALDAADIQARLRDKGIPLHFGDVGL